MVHATPRAVFMPIASRDLYAMRFNWRERCAARQAPFKKRKINYPRANRAGTISAGCFWPLLTVAAGLYRPAAGDTAGL